MNRQDFELIARTIKAWPLVGKERLALSFANAIAKSDGCSGFDLAAFLKACGVSDAP